MLISIYNKSQIYLIYLYLNIFIIIILLLLKSLIYISNYCDVNINGLEIDNFFSKTPKEFIHMNINESKSSKYIIIFKKKFFFFLKNNYYNSY